MVRTALVAISALGPALTLAQAGTFGWFYECIDPANEQPYSDDFATQAIGNQLMVARDGLSGTVTYGGENGPCYAPEARTLDAVGRMAFYVGNTGTLQTDFDNGMALTMGAPRDAVGDFTYGKILKNGNLNSNSVLYGSGGLSGAFVGASNRYMVTFWGDSDVFVEREIKILGDAARIRWRIRNVTADVQNLGLLFACYPGMRTVTAGVVDSQDGTNQSNSLLNSATGIPKLTPDRYIGYTVLPTGRPVRNERRYDSANPKFPPFAEFFFGQTEAFGMRVDNTPPPETPDATGADLFLVGNQGYFLSPGLTWNNEIRLNVFLDPPSNPTPKEEADITLSQTAFVQRFPVRPVPAAASIDIVHYVRSTWSTGDYSDPYAAVVDAPKLISPDPSGINGLSPNPMTIRAYLDNQYATLDREVALQNVQFTITLPTGLALAAGETFTKTIDRIAPNQIDSVQWRVVADGKAFGAFKFRVKVDPTPGPTKTIEGTVRIAATPKLELRNGPNMVTIPYLFNDTSMEAILGLQNGTDYVAYRWEPDQFGYVPALTVERGTGYWIVPNNDLAFRDLAGAKQPTDQSTGGLVVNLKQGWNLIGNPYPYAVPLSQLVLVAEDSPRNSLTWIDAVQSGYVQSSLSYYVRNTSLPGGGSYAFTVGPNDFLEPHRAYWLFSNSFAFIRLQWPEVFLPGLPDAGRAPTSIETGSRETWKQTDRNWRLQLSARSANGIDPQNFIGVVADSKKAKELQIRKPPAAPRQNVELYVEQALDGKPTRMAYSFATRQGRTSWDVKVKVREPGEVTLTWPNLPSMPRNVRMRLTDLATNETRDLRAVSGYTFKMAEAGVREFKVTSEIGGSSRPVIGSVLVSNDGRGPSSPVTLSYALSADALVTVRVLSSTGREVFTLTRGRADSAGQNTVTWALRDQANRAVAPGVYRFEILAETPQGERVRRIVPVTVVR
ncbi:MAG: hypothetical protein KF884_00295 [Fimbriimonadaceae bacterium]|nr:hypothetical protein [Fimbriimonadaceae bacterium]QYK58535.1 MAG: hypothetical protein KF884_00295 [Fimbriimonadaceae bacterium]